MKNILLWLLCAFLLVATMPDAYAGFMVKKNSVTNTFHATAISTHPASISSSETAGNIKQLVNHPLDRWSARGRVGALALICGVLGFILPFFAFAALLFGFMGMGRRRNRNTSLAIAGFVLGAIVVLLVVFGAFTGWGIS